MSVVPFPQKNDKNPLNDMEDLLEASGYSHNRESETRLSFMCESRQTCYTIILEWHTEFDAVKCTVILQDCKDMNREIIEVALEKSNQAAWHGFFMIDGVGNISFKTIVKKTEECPIATMATIEDTIDKAIEEVDRIYITLCVDHNDDNSDGMFPDDEWKIENLTLMFSEPKGNA